MKREKETLREWAKANAQAGFDKQARESCWLKRNDQTYLREWNFETVPEVCLLLEQLEIRKYNPKAFEEIRKTVLVSIMKGRKEKQEVNADHNIENISLPEYICVLMTGFILSLIYLLCVTKSLAV